MMWISNSNFGVKLVVSLLTFLLVFRLFHHRFFEYSPLVENARNNSTSVENAQFDSHALAVEKCDLSVGDWVPNEAQPSYNMSCKFIIDPQNCMKNGRPDSGFLQWRWRPRGCELARFDPVRFLEMMRNKNWGFVGDSLTCNHVQALLCMLSTVEEAIQVYHDETFQSLKWIFPSYNISISVIWSPFLIKSIIPRNIYDPSPSKVDIHLDILDPTWTEHFRTWDYTIFSSGKWFSRSSIYYENNTIIGCHSCPERNLTELPFQSAYRRAISRVFDYIITTTNQDSSVFYRTTSPEHIDGVEWLEGGNCSRREPAREGEFELTYVDRVIREVELEEFGKAYERGLEEGVKLRMMDVNPMLLLRPDGHPGQYRFSDRGRKGKKVISDCLHWCLPGPIDSWNDVLMEMILNA